MNYWTQSDKYIYVAAHRGWREKYPENTIEAFKAAGMRDDVKIIVGGAPVTETVCASVGADEWALSPQKTVSVCQAWAS